MAANHQRTTTPATPWTPSTIANSDLPWRKRVPFNLVGRGVAGVDEMHEYLEDTKVYFGLIEFEIGSGSFKRSKSIFVHFNGESHPKPLRRAKANKKMNAAKKLLSPYHAELTLENSKQCSIDYIFSKLGNIFVSDNAAKGDSTFEIGSLKDEYKKKMKEARKKAKAEKERLEKQRQKLLAQQESERRLIEDARLKKELEERRQREAEEAERKRKEEAERLRLLAEEEAERLRLEKEAADAAAEQAEKDRIAQELEDQRKAEEAAKKKKKKKKKKRRKKDDWSSEREWTGERIVKCIHAQTSPMNWAVFKPSATEVIPMAFGHGDLNDLRSALKGDQVQYGIMRLTFGEGRFRRSHWVFVCWSPDSMTKVDSQKVRKKRMSSRMVCIGHKGWMQKAIGPYGVEVLASFHEDVTMEDWILRVRKTVVVDGEAIDAESFRKALQAEKAHFEARRRKAEEARLAKEEEERKANMGDESSSEEGVYDKELAKKNKKKRKRMANTTGVEIEEEEESKEEETKEEESKEEKESENENGNDESKVESESKLERSNTSQLNVDASGVKHKRKSSVDPSVLKARDVSSQLCYESITLIKRPETDLVWVLIEPRLKGRK